MKTVFSNSMVAHIWAQQNQERGRNSNRSMSFDGPCFYSYRTVIAEFHNDLVLVSSTGYSNTTTRHQGYVKGSLSEEQEERMLHVPGKWGADNLHEKRNLKNLLDYVESELKHIFRTTKKHKAERKEALLHKIAHYRKIETALGFTPEPMPLSVFRKAKKQVALDKEHAAYMLKSYEERRAIEKQRQEEWRKGARSEKARDLWANKKSIVKERIRNKRKAWKGSFDERMERVRPVILRFWKAGFIDRLPYCKGLDYLRLRGENVETSNRATVPIEHAKRIWPLLERIIAGQTTLDRSIRVGYFAIDSYDGDIFKAGCHNIPASEIQDIAKRLKLVKEEEVCKD